MSILHYQHTSKELSDRTLSTPPLKISTSNFSSLSYLLATISYLLSFIRYAQLLAIVHSLRSFTCYRNIIYAITSSYLRSSHISLNHLLQGSPDPLHLHSILQVKSFQSTYGSLHLLHQKR